MARIAHEARDTPIDRPMNRVSKNWLGCADKADYLTTMELLNQHDPAVAGRFQGASPACEMLTEGTPVTLAFVDAEAHLAQVRVSASGRLLWTDPSALDGG